MPKSRTSRSRPRSRRPPWERQRHEPPRAYHGFQHFRDQKIHSCFEAYKTHRRECMRLPVDHLLDAPKHWRVWSAHWGWVDRAAAWEAEMDRQVRAKLIVAQTEARERHARLAQAMLTVLSLPVKAALEAARDPEFVPRLTASALASPSGANALVAQVAKISTVVPAVVTMERLALGLTTDAISVEERDDPINFADRIASDPAATELAIQLLDQLARPRESLALGAGLSGEPGQVADGPAPEPPHETSG